MSSATLVTLFLVVVSLYTSDAGSNVYADKRIINGQEAFDEEFKYQASLRTFPDKIHFCGGSIVKPTWILTAAHCLERVQDYVIVVGTIYSNDSGEIYDVAREIVHPFFNHSNGFYDVGLIQTTTSIIYDSKTNEIDLASSLPVSNYYVVISGWGSTSYPAFIPLNLMWVETQRISLELCQRYYLYFGYTLHPSQICTIRYWAGVCFGDSGSPVVTDGRQIGVVSRVIPCAAGFPDIHVNIPYTYDWISSYIEV